MSFYGSSDSKETTAFDVNIEKKIRAAFSQIASGKDIKSKEMLSALTSDYARIFKKLADDKKKLEADLKKDEQETAKKVDALRKKVFEGKDPNFTPERMEREIEKLESAHEKKVEIANAGMVERERDEVLGFYNNVMHVLGVSEAEAEKFENVGILYDLFSENDLDDMHDMLTEANQALRQVIKNRKSEMSAEKVNAKYLEQSQTFGTGIVTALGMLQEDLNEYNQGARAAKIGKYDVDLKPFEAKHQAIMAKRKELIEKHNKAIEETQSAQKLVNRLIIKLSEARAAKDEAEIKRMELEVERQENRVAELRRLQNDINDSIDGVEDEAKMVISDVKKIASEISNRASNDPLFKDFKMKSESLIDNLESNHRNAASARSQAFSEYRENTAVEASSAMSSDQKAVQKLEKAKKSKTLESIDDDEWVGRLKKGFYAAATGFRKDGAKGSLKGLLGSMGNDIHKSINKWKTSGGLGGKIAGTVLDASIKMIRKAKANNKFRKHQEKLRASLVAIKGVEKKLNGPNAQTIAFLNAISGMNKVLNARRREDALNIATFGRFGIMIDKARLGGDDDFGKEKETLNRYKKMLEKGDHETAKIFKDVTFVSKNVRDYVEKNGGEYKERKFGLFNLDLKKGIRKAITEKVNKFKDLFGLGPKTGRRAIRDNDLNALLQYYGSKAAKTYAMPAKAIPQVQALPPSYSDFAAANRDALQQMIDDDMTKLAHRDAARMMFENDILSKAKPAPHPIAPKTRMFMGREVPAFAEGGPLDSIDKGSFGLVGEKGPELIRRGKDGKFEVVPLTKLKTRFDEAKEMARYQLALAKGSARQRLEGFDANAQVDAILQAISNAIPAKVKNAAFDSKEMARYQLALMKGMVRQKTGIDLDMSALVDKIKSAIPEQVKDLPLWGKIAVEQYGPKLKALPGDAKAFIEMHVEQYGPEIKKQFQKLKKSLLKSIGKDVDFDTFLTDSIMNDPFQKSFTKRIEEKFELLSSEVQTRFEQGKAWGKGKLEDYSKKVKDKLEELSKNVKGRYDVLKSGLLKKMGLKMSQIDSEFDAFLKESALNDPFKDNTLKGRMTGFFKGLKGKMFGKFNLDPSMSIKDNMLAKLKAFNPFKRKSAAQVVSGAESTAAIAGGQSASAIAEKDEADKYSVPKNVARIVEIMEEDRSKLGKLGNVFGGLGKLGGMLGGLGGKMKGLAGKAWTKMKELPLWAQIYGEQYGPGIKGKLAGLGSKLKGIPGGLKGKLADAKEMARYQLALAKGSARQKMGGLSGMLGGLRGKAGRLMGNALTKAKEAPIWAQAWLEQEGARAKGLAAKGVEGIKNIPIWAQIYGEQYGPSIKERLGNFGERIGGAFGSMKSQFGSMKNQVGSFMNRKDPRFNEFLTDSTLNNPFANAPSAKGGGLAGAMKGKLGGFAGALKGKFSGKLGGLGGAVKGKLGGKLGGFAGAVKGKLGGKLAGVGGFLGSLKGKFGKGAGTPAPAAAAVGGKMQYESASAVEAKQAHESHIASIDKNVQLIVDILQKQNGGPGEKKKGLLESILDGLLALAGMIPGLMSTLNILKKGLSHLKDFGKKLIDGAKGLFEKTKDLAKGAWEGAKRGLGKAWEGAKNLGRKAGDVAKRGLGKAAELAKKAAPAAKGALKLAGKGARAVGSKIPGLNILFGAYDAYEGYNDDEFIKQHFKLKEGEKPTDEQRRAAAADRAISGLLTLGLAPKGSFLLSKEKIPKLNTESLDPDVRYADVRKDPNWDPSFEGWDTHYQRYKEGQQPKQKEGQQPQNDWVAARMAQLGLDKQRKANPDAAIEAQLKIDDYNIAKTRFRNIYFKEHGLLKDGKGVIDPKYTNAADAEFKEFWKKYQERQAGIVPEDMKSSEEIKAKLEEKNPINPILDAFDEFNKDNKEKLKESEGLEPLPKPLVPPHVQPLGASPAPGITPSNPQQGSNDPKAYELRQFAVYAKQHGIQMNPDGTFALTPDQMKEARLIDLSKLPHYAEGGIVDPSRDGQLAVIGEGGEKEAVMPMSKLANFLLEAFNLKKSIDKESTAKMLESAKRALGLGGEDRSKLGTQFVIENAITDIQKNVESIYKMMRYIKVDGVALGDYLDNKPNAAAAKAGLTQGKAGAGGPGGSPAGAASPTIPGVPAAGPSAGPSAGPAGGVGGGDAGGGTQQFVPQAGVSADGKRLGFIAMKRESGGNAAQVSGDTGNSHSYGLYQFNTGKNDSGGTMHTFVNYLAKNYSNLYQPLAGKRIGSKEFNAAFQQVASANRAQMEQAQEEHLKNAYYTPAINELKKTPEGKEILSKYANDRAFQEMFISTAIQHGPAGARSILSAAWNANPDKNSLKSFIGSVYNERGSARRFKTAMAEEAKKGRDPQKFLSNMQRQYKDEAGRVLGLLGQSAPTGGQSPAPAAPMQAPAGPSPTPAAPMQASGGPSPATPAPAAPMQAGPTIPGATGGSGLAGVAMGFGNFKYGMYKSGGGYARYNQLTKDASGRWVAGSKGGVATMDCSQYVSAVAANMGFEKWAKGGATAEVMRQDLKGNGMRQSLNDVQEGDILFTVGGSKHTSGAGHVAVVIRDPNNPNQLMVAESTGSSRGGYNGGFKMTPLNQYVDWQAKRRGRQFGTGVQIYPSPMTGKAAPAGMQGTPGQEQAQSPGAAAAPAMGGAGGPASPAAMGGGMPAGGMAGAAGAATGGMPFAMPQMPPSLLGALFGGFGGFGGQRGGGGIGSLFGGLGRGIGGLLGGLVGGVGSVLGGIFGGIGSLFSGLFGGGKEEAPSPAGGGGILDFLMGGGTPSGGMQPGMAAPMQAPAGPSPAPAAPMAAPTIPGVGGGTTGPIRQLAMPQTGGKELVELSNEGDGKNPKAFLNAKGMRWQRNKNVGSIKALKGQSSDGRDRVFSTFSEGILEMHNLLGRNYFAKGQDTIESILYKYAPPSDGNNTEEYINFVCKKTGFQRNQKLNFNDSNQMAALQRAMIAFETSHQFKMDEIKGIYAAAGKQDGGTGTPQLSMPGQGQPGGSPTPAAPMQAPAGPSPTPAAPTPAPTIPGAGPTPASPSAGGTGGPMEAMPTQQNQQPSLGGGGLAGRILGIARRRAGEAGKGGYSQDNRLASNQYDCSSFVARSLQEAGFDINPAEFNTRSMQTILPTKGFVFNRGLGGLQVGDILWRPGHTEIYAGNNRTIGAHSGRSGVSEYAYKGNLEQYTGYWRFKGQEALSQEQQAAISQEQGAIPQGGTPPTIPGQEGGNVQGQMQGVQQPDAGGAAGPAAGPQIQGSQQSNLADKASEFYSNGGGGGGANVNAPTTNIFGQGGDEKNGATFITAKDPMSWVVLQGNCVH